MHSLIDLRELYYISVMLFKQMHAQRPQPRAQLDKKANNQRVRGVRVANSLVPAPIIAATYMPAFRNFPVSTASAKALYDHWWRNAVSVCTQACMAVALAVLVYMMSPAAINWCEKWLREIKILPPLKVNPRSAVKANALDAAHAAVVPVDAPKKDNIPEPEHANGSDKHASPWSNELEARAAMEHMMQMPFPKARPQWLLNPTSGRALELDLYNESLALAVEVDGKQHAEFPNAFHATREMFDQQQLRDSLKDTLCRLQKVQLIRVPHTVKRKHIKAFLQQKLVDSGRLPSNSKIDTEA